MQAVGQPQQSAELRIARSPDERVDLLGVQARISVQGVLIESWVFSKHQLDGLTERRMAWRARWGFPFRWHEQHFYSSAGKNNRAHIGYHDCRQASSSQFGEVSISERAQGREILHCLGEAFQQIRSEHARTVDELAATTGVPATRIRALEAGELDPDYEMLLLLADALGVPSSLFILRTEALAKQGSDKS